MYFIEQINTVVVETNCIVWLFIIVKIVLFDYYRYRDINTIIKYLNYYNFNYLLVCKLSILILYYIIEYAETEFTI